jgi:DNA-binding NtrC family response regulator
VSGLASLIVMQGADRGARHRLLPETNRLGRDPLGEVVVYDPAASRLHAEVVWDPARQEFALLDQGSRNGTLLNGLPCREETLRPGDEVRIGETVLVFCTGEAGPGRTGASTIVLRDALPDQAGAASHASGALVLERPPELIGRSPSFLRVLEATARAARTASPVLILGESGTGKELLAQAVHRASPRRGGPLVCVNAATLSDAALCASELFGHERGAFTGAVARRAGCLERAHGGTLFLDEVGDLPLETQAKLLRALETKRFARVGGSEEIESDLRLVAATNRHLDDLVAAGSFRQDLLFRLDVVRLELPPLRDRPGDVDLLVEHTLGRLRGEMPTPVTGASEGALAALRAYAWPGNVRELRNVLERALIFAAGPELTADDLPRGLGTPEATAPTPSRDEPVRSLAEVERDAIVRALRATGGNKTKAAVLLGVDRKTLRLKVERHGLGETRG